MDIAYKTINDRVNNKVPEIKFIDWDVDQLEDANNGIYPPDFPCLLVGIEPSECSTIGGNLQEIDMQFTMKLAFKKPENVNNLTPKTVREAGFNRLKILKSLHKYLQGFIGSNFNTLDRILIEQEKRDDDLVVFIMTYQTLLSDNSAVEVTAEKTVTLEIKSDNE